LGKNIFREGSYFPPRKLGEFNFSETSPKIQFFRGGKFSKKGPHRGKPENPPLKAPETGPLQKLGGGDF